MTDEEHKLEELWDWICVQVGFDEKGKEIQGAIKEYIKINEVLSRNNKRKLGKNTKRGRAMGKKRRILDGE